MGINKINVPRRANLRKGIETRSFQASAITVVRWGTKLQTAGNIRLIKTRDPRIGRRRKKKRK